MPDYSEFGRYKIDIVDQLAKLLDLYLGKIALPLAVKLFTLSFLFEII